jgi:hypothetical protein
VERKRHPGLFVQRQPHPGGVRGQFGQQGSSIVRCLNPSASVPLVKGENIPSQVGHLPREECRRRPQGSS